MDPYLVLLRVGFTIATPVTSRAVRSYRTFSPLPRVKDSPAVSFLLHFPWAHAPQVLPGTLTSGARTFLHQLTWQRSSNRLETDCTGERMLAQALFVFKRSATNTSYKSRVFKPENSATIVAARRGGNSSPKRSSSVRVASSIDD